MIRLVLVASITLPMFLVVAGSSISQSTPKGGQWSNIFTLNICRK
jgi:hypothetical protein